VAGSNAEENNWLRTGNICRKKGRSWDTITLACQQAPCSVTLSSKYIVGVEWTVAIGLYGQPNSLPGGFAEVELEGDETVASAVFALFRSAII
jgi:hypothetical protein